MHGIALASLHSPLDDAFALEHDLLTALEKHGQTQPTAGLTQHRRVNQGGTAKSSNFRSVFDWNQLLDMKSFLASNSRTI